MSVKVIKSETTEYKILVKLGDEELARKEAVKAAISAEAARLSAIAASDSEQVATEKAAQTVEDAASALASKQDAESAATASGGFATDSGISAAASNTAKGLSEAAKNLILNKAEVNITTAGHVLLADGTLFKSVPQVEFLRNKDAFAKSFSAMFMGFSFLENWGASDENQSYKGDNYTLIDGFKTMPVSTLSGRINGRITFRTGRSNASDKVSIAFMVDVNNYFEIRVDRVEMVISQKLNGVVSILANQNQTVSLNALRFDVRSFEFNIVFDSFSNVYRFNILTKADSFNFSTGSLVFTPDLLNKFGIRSTSGNIDFITFI